MIKFGSDKINNIAYRGTDDVARAVLGGDWRMPTYSELQELFYNTTQEYTTIENVSVCKCVAKNGSGKYIVFPIIGNIGYANYWTSSRVENEPDKARYVRIYTDRYLLSSHSRYLKYLIRAVSPTKGVDLGLPSGLKWAECNVGANTPTEYGGYFQWGEMNRNNREIWSDYKFNPSGDGVTFTKYNETDGKITLELDCDNEIHRVIQDRDIVFNRPIYSSKYYAGSENFSAVSACAVLDALQPVTTPQTITFSAYTTSLINASNNALAKVYDAVQKGWTIVGEGLKEYVELEYAETSGTQYITTDIIAIPSVVRMGISPNDVTIRQCIGFDGVATNFFGIRNGKWEQVGSKFADAVLGEYYDVLWDFGKGEENKHRLYVNGQTIGYGSSINPNPPTNGFRTNIVSYLNAKFYYLSIENGEGNKLIDLIPVRKMDGVVCFYDKVSGNFITHKGTGSLIGGEPKQD